MSRGKRTKTAFIYLKVTPEFKDKVKEQAETKNRTVTRYIEELVTADIAKKK